MNSFDVRAIGWVVTRDAGGEIARALLGARRRISRTALRSLGERWRAACACLDEEAHNPGRSLLALATELSPRSERMVGEFVLHLAAVCPALYGERALRDRWRSAAARALVGFAGGIAANSFATTGQGFFGDAAIVLLVMGCCSLIVAIQLLRMHRIATRLGHCLRAAQSRPAPNAASADEPQSAQAARTGSHEGPV